MFSLAADMQCDFGSYLFTRGGDKKGWQDEAEWEKETQRRRERQTVKKKRQRVRERETSRGGDRCQEAGVRGGE